VSSSRFPILRGTDAQQSRVQDNVSALVSPLARALQNTPIMGAAPVPYVAPSRQAALADLLGGYAPLGFRVDQMGNVHLRGGVLSAAGVAANTVAFVLPVAARPAYQHDFATTQGPGIFQITSVFSDGRVVMVNAIAAGSWSTFDGVSFLAGG
jgi:hypothetical protein